MPPIDDRPRMPRRTSGARRATVVVVLPLVALVTACASPATAPTGPQRTPSSIAPSSLTAAPSQPSLAVTPAPLPGAITVTGRSSTVTGTLDRASLTAYAQMADRAVSDVSAHWSRPWARTVGIVAPRDAAAFRAQVGRADDLSQVAAITLGPLDGAGLATQDEIILNPDAFARLTPAGRQFVITHESTHVAVRSTLPGTAPLWLVEGFADHVGYAGSGRTRLDLAAPMLDQVAGGSGPQRLPTLQDFDPARGEIASSYLAAWLAVDLVARAHGEAQLERFVVASSVTGLPAAAETAMDAAFVSVLGTTRDAFTRAWLADLDQLAASR